MQKNSINIRVHWEKHEFVILNFTDKKIKMCDTQKLDLTWKTKIYMFYKPELKEIISKYFKADIYGRSSEA